MAAALALRGCAPRGTGARLQAGRHARALRAARGRIVRVRAEKGASEADSFLESPLGKFVAWLGESLNASKLNEGKVKFAIMQAGEYDEASTRAQMEELIAGNPVMVYSFSTCPFCVKAKALLDDLGVEYTAAELDKMEGGYALRAELAKETGRTSMPNIWIAGEGIGGCNDGPGLMTLYKEGTLMPKLESAGALASK